MENLEREKLRSKENNKKPTMELIIFHFKSQRFKYAQLFVVVVVVFLHQMTHSKLHIDNIRSNSFEKLKMTWLALFFLSLAFFSRLHMVEVTYFIFYF